MTDINDITGKFYKQDKSHSDCTNQKIIEKSECKTRWSVAHVVAVYLRVEVSMHKLSLMTQWHFKMAD